jgi:hypothetical protein
MSSLQAREAKNTYLLLEEQAHSVLSIVLKKPNWARSMVLRVGLAASGV